MKSIFLISIIILLFGGVNVLIYFGWNPVLEFSPYWQKILPSFYILIILLTVGFTNKTKEFSFRKNKEEYNILIFIAVLISFLWVNNEQTF